MVVPRFINFEEMREMRIKELFLIVVLYFIIGNMQLFSAEGKLKNDGFLKDKNGNITGFRFDVSNTSKDGSSITSVSFFIVIYKWEDGKRIFLGLEQYVSDCNIYQGYYDTFEFYFKEWYGKAKDFGYEWAWSFSSSK